MARARSLAEFQKSFPDEESCAAFLFKQRWPDGFVCPGCGKRRVVGLKSRPRLHECLDCGRQTSVKSGSAMKESVGRPCPEQRMLEIEDVRLVVKFGEKRRYSDREYEAIYEELIAAGLDDEAIRDPDAIEAVYRKLNAADEAEAARRALGGPSTVP